MTAKSRLLTYIKDLVKLGRFKKTADTSRRLFNQPLYCMTIDSALLHQVFMSGDIFVIGCVIYL